MSKVLTIIHFSDWHGDWTKLPPADVYCCTGDMYPNYLLPEVDGRLVNPAREQAQQLHYAADVLKYTRGFRESCLGSPEAPVVCVRGNHDFAPLAPLFQGGMVYEFGRNLTHVKLQGVMFGGARGVPERSHEWSDELSDDAFEARLNKLPPTVRVLLTHTPAMDLLDYPDDKFHDGSFPLRCYLEDHPPVAALCGHAHGARGQCTFTLDCGADVYISNAATDFNVIVLDVA